MSNGWISTPLDTTWPDPADPLGVESALRYGQPTRGQLMWAASVIGAYQHLAGNALSQSRRDLSVLRRAAETAGGEQHG